MRSGYLTIILAWTGLLLNSCSTGAGASGGGGGVEPDPKLTDAITAVGAVWVDEPLEGEGRDTRGPTVVRPKPKSNSPKSLDVEITAVDADHTLADIDKLRIAIDGFAGHFVIDVAGDDQTVPDSILVTIVLEDAGLIADEFVLQVVAEDADGQWGEIVEVPVAFFAASAGDWEGSFTGPLQLDSLDCDALPGIEDGQVFTFHTLVEENTLTLGLPDGMSSPSTSIDAGGAFSITRHALDVDPSGPDCGSVLMDMDGTLQLAENPRTLVFQIVYYDDCCSATYSGTFTEDDAPDGDLTTIPAGTYTGEITEVISQSLDGGAPQETTRTQTADYLFNEDGYVLTQNAVPEGQPQVAGLTFEAEVDGGQLSVEVIDAALGDGTLTISYTFTSTTDRGDEGVLTETGTVTTTYTLQGDGRVLVESTIDATSTVGDSVFATTVTGTGTLTRQE